MRRDDLYLNDIIEAADHIATFLSGLDFVGFLNSELVRSAVVQKLAIIGGAAALISEELRYRHPQIPWPQWEQTVRQVSAAHFHKSGFIGEFQKLVAGAKRGERPSFLELAKQRWGKSCES